MNDIRKSIKSEAELESKFREFDGHNRGFNDHKQFKKLYSSIGRSMSDHEVETAMIWMDRKNEGKISLEEFKVLV